ncbi:splicing factor U2AF 35 kDa subunit isoform 5-T5 [Vipera latastei]
MLEWYLKNMVQIQKKIAYNLRKILSNSQKVVSLQLSIICTAASRIPLFIFFSPQTILIQNIYRNPQNSAQTADGSHCAVSDVEMQEHYDEFFEEVFTEMEEKYGEVEEMNVCDNLGDHLVGNVYVKFRREEDAEKAVIDLNNRWFNGQPIHAELSPVTDFREACCRQYEMGECTRGGFCNFMHLKPISRELRRELYGRRRKKLSDLIFCSHGVGFFFFFSNRLLL